MTGQKLYISGPIKGIPNAETNFRAAAEELFSAGHEPVSPFDCLAECGFSTECPGVDPDAHYDHYLRGDLIEMLSCDGVALLPGWDASRGARIEQSTAVMVGIPVMVLSEWLPFKITDRMVQAFGEAWKATPEGEPGDRRRVGLQAALAVQEI